jgi:hypothetical protein
MYPSPSEGLIWRIVDDELIVVRPGDGDLLVLNEVGAFIWQSMDGKQTVAELSRLVCDEYEVGPDEAQADVAEFLQELDSQGLLAMAAGN